MRSYTALISSGVRRTAPVASERHVASAKSATTPSKSPASSSSAYRYTSALISSRSATSAEPSGPVMRRVSATPVPKRSGRPEDGESFGDALAMARLLATVESQQSGDGLVGFVVRPLLVAGISGDLTLDDRGQHRGIDPLGQRDREPLLQGGRRLVVMAELQRDGTADATSVTELLAAVAAEQLRRTVIANTVGQQVVEVLATALELVEQLERGN